jgi:hypothetical protein
MMLMSQLAMLALLVTRGGVVESPDENGTTPVHTSIYTYQQKTAQCLLRACLARECQRRTFEQVSS